jgi:hypothetical protein
MTSRAALARGHAVSEETGVMSGFRRTLAVSATAALVISAVAAADLKVDLLGERPGKLPQAFASYFKDYEAAAR